jgi:hypothetical protein
MDYDANTIASQIKDYIDTRGGNYSGWYVGITKDPEARLFRDHNADQKNGQWIYWPAASRNDAERIEKYFTQQLGTMGNPGGGDDKTTWVYAYKIEWYTKQ